MLYSLYRQGIYLSRLILISSVEPRSSFLLAVLLKWGLSYGVILSLFFLEKWGYCKWDAVQLPASSGIDRFGNRDAVVLTVSMKANDD